jgi:PAS domain S-box-containing protein
MSRFSDILEQALQEEAVLLSSDLKVRSANNYFFLSHNLIPADIENKQCNQVLQSCSVFCRQAAGECPVHEALAAGTKVSVILEDVETENGIRHFAVEVYPVLPEEGEERLLLHITRDITARVNEERLKEEMWREILLRLEHLYGAMVLSHQRIEGIGRELDQLTDLLPMAMIWWDNDGRITRINPSAEVLLGWNQDELIGRQLTTLFASGAAQSRCRQAITATLLGQTMGYSLAENRTASGSLLTCEWFHTPLQNENGLISGALSLGQDVSARFTAEKRLEIARQKITALLKASFDSVAMINSLGRIVEWNQASENLFGWRPKEIIGQGVEILFPSEQQDSQRDFLRNFISHRGRKDSGKQISQINVMRRDGSVFPASLLLIRTQIDGSPGAVAVFHDLSEQLHIRALLERSEKLKEVGRLAHGLARRFNSRLSSLLDTVDLLRGKVDDDDMLPYLELLVESVEEDRLAIRNLLTHSGHYETEAGQRDINQLLDEVVRLTSFRWQHNAEGDGRIVIDKSFASSLPGLVIKGDDFREMIIALLFNAIDCLPDGGTIKISTRMEKEGIAVDLEDNGPGISREDLPRIFIPFYTTKGIGHAGMGLTMARNIARQYGGDITVTSTAALGSRFTVWLPLVPAGHEIEAKNPKGLRILLAAADQNVRRVLEENLTANGHQLAVTDDGRQAILLSGERPFDLVISGEDCGGMNGRELIWRIKHRAPETPALLLLDTEGTDSRLKAMADGADLVLVRPVSAQQVQNAIEQLSLPLDDRIAGKKPADQPLTSGH